MAWDKSLAEQAKQSVEEAEAEGTTKYEFEYMLLARMKSDCEYYINTHGTETSNQLWAKNPAEQIEKMQALYDTVPEKPEWLSQEDIHNFAKAMGVSEEKEQVAQNIEGNTIAVEREIEITAESIERYGAFEKDCYTFNPEQDVLDEIINRVSSIEVSFATSVNTENVDCILYVDTDENQSFVDLRASAPDLGIDISVPITESERSQTIEAVSQYEATYIPPEHDTEKTVGKSVKKETSIEK